MPVTSINLKVEANTVVGNHNDLPSNHHWVKRQPQENTKFTQPYPNASGWPLIQALEKEEEDKDVQPPLTLTIEKLWQFLPLQQEIFLQEATTNRKEKSFRYNFFANQTDFPK